MKWYYIVAIVVVSIAVGYAIKSWMDSSSTTTAVTKTTTGGGTGSGTATK